MSSIWRRPFDVIERPIAAASEAWVQTDTFMDLAAVAFKLRRRLTRDTHRAAEQWLHAFGLVSYRDVVRLMNQIASLERQVRELERDAKRREHDRQLDRHERDRHERDRRDRDREPDRPERDREPERREDRRRPAGQPPTRAA
jgi:hypothetical protein